MEFQLAFSVLIVLIMFAVALSCYLDEKGTKKRTERLKKEQRINRRIENRIRQGKKSIITRDF